MHDICRCDDPKKLNTMVGCTNINLSVHRCEMFAFDATLR